MFGSKIMLLQMGPFFQFRGPVITLVPSTPVGFCLSLSIAETLTVVLLIDLRRAELPACYPPHYASQRFVKKGQTD